MDILHNSDRKCESNSTVEQAGGRPVALKVIAENIPHEMRRLSRWAVWRNRKTEKGEWKKPPFCAMDRRPTSHRHRADWGSFEAAYRCYCDYGFDGIGFLLSTGPTDLLDMTFLDLDKEPPEDMVAALLDLHTYTEISPSGRGFHGYAWGHLPAVDKNKRGHAEAYDHLRYFTVTGHRLPIAPAVLASPTEAELIQYLAAVGLRKVDTGGVGAAESATEKPAAPPAHGKACADGYGKRNRLDDEQVLERILRTPNGPALWAGDSTAYNSESEADAALVQRLSYYTGRDVEQMDRLFRRSGLMDAKWDSSRGQTTYGRYTIDKINANQRTTFYDKVQAPKKDPRPEPAEGGASLPGKDAAAKAPPGAASSCAKDAAAKAPPGAASFPPMTWLHGLERQFTENRWLAEGLLGRGMTTSLTAQWKAGKTTLLAHFLRTTAQGGLFLGRRVEACNVLIISEEHGDDWIDRREELQLPANVALICLPFLGKPTMADWIQFIGYVEKQVQAYPVRPWVIVIDTAASVWPVRDENSNSELDATLRPLRRLTIQGHCVLVVHHNGKANETFRGASAYGGFFDVLLELRTHDGPDTRCRVLTGKGRKHKIPDRLVIRLEEDGLTYRLIEGAESPDSTIPTVIAAVLAEQDHPLTAEQIREHWPAGRKQPKLTTIQHALLDGVTVDPPLWLREGPGGRGGYHYFLPQKDAAAAPSEAASFSDEPPSEPGDNPDGSWGDPDIDIPW